ncbi:hypothetical protein [Xanthomonas phaseoli]|uniref:hypothetical protein n=1 Tax=Xanthomonas phaseoli TaxID=1985254 RepID=UPI001E3856C4|nr:hypothetical protein [Xanthomonas phaseoli]MCC8470607.1 hypothetical protein [Xanthomonas phaseoli]
MFLVKSNGSSAVVPGFLLAYHGEAMMPEYHRYMSTLPIILAANAACSIVSAYALIYGSNDSEFMAFAIFMAIFSVKMFTQRLVRVNFTEVEDGVTSAPFAVKLNNLLTGVCLLMMGVGFLRLTGDFNSIFFKVFGVTMIGVSLACALAFRRGKAGLQ